MVIMGLKMNSVKVAEAKAKLSDIVNRVRYSHDRIVINKRKNPAAVIISYSDYEKLVMLEDLIESEMLRRSLQGKKYTLSDVAKRLKLEL